jgi:hypothetical protein
LDVARVAGIETCAATRGDGEVIELELGITVYPPGDKGGRWRAVWHQDGVRKQSESVSEEKLAAKLASQAQDDASNFPTQAMDAERELISELATRHREFADRLANRQSQMFPAEDPTTSRLARRSPPGQTPSGAPSSSRPSPRSSRRSGPWTSSPTTTGTSKPPTDPAGHAPGRQLGPRTGLALIRMLQIEAN